MHPSHMFVNQLYHISDPAHPPSVLSSLLRRNALHCQPTQWQRKNLPNPGPNNPWVATYLCPIFPESPGTPASANSVITSVSSMNKLAAVKQNKNQSRVGLNNMAASVGAASSKCSSSMRGPAGEGGQVPPSVGGGPLTCAACGRLPSPRVSLMRCSRCRVVWYCCTECQERHWGAHRLVCER